MDDQKRLENHEIIYDTETGDDAVNKFDNMEKAGWFAGLDQGPINFSDHIASVFKITNKQTGEVLTNFDSTKVCPGYVIKPMLKSVSKDAKTNEYALNIDWTCINNSYVGKDKTTVDNTTAHCFNYNNGRIDLKSETQSVNDYFAPLRESASIPYKVILSSDGERKAIKEAYFNTANENIVFDWKDEDALKNAYDSFFFGERLDDGQTDTYEYLVHSAELAQTGITLTVKNGQTNETSDTIRLDALINTRKRLDPEKTTNRPNLIEDFIDNCNVSTVSIVDPKHKPNANGGNYVKNTVYVNYKNSVYEFDRKNDTKIIEDSIRTCFTLSNNVYDYLTTKFNEQMNFADTYTDNQFQDEYDAVKTDLIVQSVMYGINGLFVAQTTALCFVPVFAGHLPLYIVLLTLTWVSMAAQSIILGLFVEKRWKPIKNIKNSADKMIDSREIQTFSKTSSSKASYFSNKDSIS